MSGKFFDKNVRKICLNCAFGKESEYTGDILCKKHGITSSNDYCKHFKYDPLKRIPDIKKPAGEYNSEDFKL